MTTTVLEPAIHGDRVSLLRVLGPAHVWALGVGIVLVGEFTGWNFSADKGGALAALIVCWIVGLLYTSVAMAQSGNLVVLGDAGDALGDSIYEARLFVRGKVGNLGADCVAKEMRPEHLELLKRLLDRAGVTSVKPEEFNRYGSARTLYNFNIDNADAY